MDHLINSEDSYADRRHLFRGIWETGVTIHDKEAETVTKPKVIKTAKLDEVDRCTTSKGKKQKLRNLKNACNKILDCCDKQDNEDQKEKGNSESQRLNMHLKELKHKRRKRSRKRKMRCERLYSTPKKQSEPTTNTKSPESSQIKKIYKKRGISDSTIDNSSGAWKYYYIVKPVVVQQRNLNFPPKRLLQVHKINVHEALHV